MPNHVTNKLTIVAMGRRTQQVRDFLKPKYPRKRFDCIDFENLIPMPESKKDDWYDWRISHWGTKWNAYEQHEESLGEIWFDTAWSAPIPIIETLAMLFPDVEFHHEWADEDMGNNVGYHIYADGMRIEEQDIADQTEEAFEMYFELHPGTREMFRKVGDTYEMIDD